MGGRRIVFDNWSLGGNGLELGGGFLHFIILHAAIGRLDVMAFMHCKY